MDFIYGMVVAFAVSLYLHRRVTAKTIVQVPIEPVEEPIVEETDEQLYNEVVSNLEKEVFKEIIETVKAMDAAEDKPIPLPSPPTITGTWKPVSDDKYDSDLMITDTQFVYLSGLKMSYNYSIAMDHVMLDDGVRKYNGKFKYENGELTLMWGDKTIHYRRA